MAAAGCGGAGPEDIKVAEAEYGLANDAFHKQRYREALAHVEMALNHDEDNVEAAYLGAMCMLVFCANDETSPDCRYDAAEKFLRQALKSDGEMRDAKNALGVVLVHQKRPLEAVAVLKPLAEDILYRSPEKAWGNLGWAYLEANQLPKAIEALKRAVASQPNFCVGHYRLGVAYQTQGEFAAARQSLTRAVSIEEGDCGRLQAAFWARSQVLAKLQLADEMVEDLEKCRELSTVTDIGKKCARKLARSK